MTSALCGSSVSVQSKQLRPLLKSYRAQKLTNRFQTNLHLHFLECLLFFCLCSTSEHSYPCLSYAQYTYTRQINTKAHTAIHKRTSESILITAPKHLSANPQAVLYPPFPSPTMRVSHICVDMSVCVFVCVSSLTTTDKVAVILSCCANLP